MSSVIKGVGKVVGGLGKGFLGGNPLIGAGMGLVNMLGQRSQRKKAEARSSALNAQRNQLLSKILGSQNYGFEPNQAPNLNEQNSATRAY